jgi:hypothetical protein
MNPSNYCKQLVAETQIQSPGLSPNDAWNLAARAYPEAFTLAAACGLTDQQISFWNEREAAKQAAPGKLAARDKFLDLVHGRMEEVHCDYDRAWAWAQRHHVECFNEMTAAQKPAQFTNEAPAVFGPQLKALFRLPADSTQEECRAAWDGNGDIASPFNPGKVFAALVSLFMKAKLPQESAAIKYCRERFPQLWEAVEAASGATPTKKN